MTSRSSTGRSPRLLLIVGALVAVALAVPLAACGKKHENLGQAGNNAGSGQVGYAPDGGTGDVDPTTPPPATTPAATTPAPHVTTPAVVVTPLLPWPSTEDCLGHDPNNLTKVWNAGQSVWQILDGSHALLAYKLEANADTALAVAKRYKKHCFIGRDNTRTDRNTYIMDYYKDPSGISTVIPNQDCFSHTAAALAIEDLGTLGWRVNNGSEAMYLFDTKPEAQNAILVLKHFNRHCFIGRDYSGSDRKQYISDYFLSV